MNGAIKWLIVPILFVIVAAFLCVMFVLIFIENIIGGSNGEPR
jgi:hypothetical protein